MLNYLIRKNVLITKVMWKYSDPIFLIPTDQIILLLGNKFKTLIKNRDMIYPHSDTHSNNIQNKNDSSKGMIWCLSPNKNFFPSDPVSLLFVSFRTWYFLYISWLETLNFILLFFCLLNTIYALSSFSYMYDEFLNKEDCLGYNVKGKKKEIQNYAWSMSKYKYINIYIEKTGTVV